MPTVIARVVEEWLPASSRELIQHGQNFKHDFTRDLIAHLQPMVAATITEVDRKFVSPGEVVVYVYGHHPLSVNVSAFCLDVQPGNGGKTEAAKQLKRRAEISDVLGEKITNFVEHYEWSTVVHSSFELDIEIRPISSSGHMHRITGNEVEIVHSWGQPEIAD